MKKFKIVYKPYKDDDANIYDRFYVMETKVYFGKEYWVYTKETYYWPGDIYTDKRVYTKKEDALAYIERRRTPLPESYEEVV